MRLAEFAKATLIAPVVAFVTPRPRPAPGDPWRSNDARVRAINRRPDGQARNPANQIGLDWLDAEPGRWIPRRPDWLARPPREPW